MFRLSIGALQVGALGASIVALSVLGSCNESPPAAPPPPAAAYQPAPPPPALLGAPPKRDFVAMAPIPNPEDMTLAERIRVYGARYIHHHGHRAPGWWLRLHAGDHPSAAPPAPHPIFVRQASVAPAPAVAPPKPAPPKIILAAAKPAPIAAAPSPVIQLAAAVDAKSKGAILAVPADLSAAKPGAVTLSLPADLLAVIRQEAAKLGLGLAARKTDVTATLKGEGYAITPNGPQTAHLTPGKPTIFTWTVKPGLKAKGPLTAEVGALLKGAGDAKAFTLAKLNQAVAAVKPAVTQAKAATHWFTLASLDLITIHGHKDVTLPVVGKTPYKIVFGAAIGLILLFILLMSMLGAIRRRDTNQVLFYRTPSGEPVMATPKVLEEQRVEPVSAAPEEEAPAWRPWVADHAPDAAAAEPVLAEHALVEARSANAPETPTIMDYPLDEPAAAHIAEAGHQVEAPATAEPAPMEQWAAMPADHEPAPEPVLAEPSLAEAAGVGYPVAVEHPVAEAHSAPVEHTVGEVVAPLAEHGPSVVGLAPAEVTPAETPANEPEVVYVEEHAATGEHAIEPAQATDHAPTETAFDHHHPELETA